jgi:hypothetical protein
MLSIEVAIANITVSITLKMATGVFAETLVYLQHLAWLIHESQSR